MRRLGPAILIGSLCWGPAAADETVPRHQVPRAETAIVVDGVLDEGAWGRALRLTLDYEVRPGENVSPPVRTECWVTYDDRHVYFAFRAHDPDPGAIRARFSDRDRAWGDDWVGVVLDTFNDQRRAYELFSNPLGVQIDAINDDVGGNYDDSWNAIWESAGKITNGGYEVEMAIPFHQIRFPSADGEQVWGFDALRSYPRGDRHHIGLFPRDRGNNSYLSQAVKLVGMAGASPGRNLEILPTVTASRTDARPALSRTSLERGDAEGDVGVSVRWGITPNVSLNGAVNPDFSQVEADAVQLDINQQFALFFPETRPFFLEGADYFNTSLDLVHTRTLVDPAAAAKVTGKQGSHTYGVFTARDDVTAMIFPGSQGSSGGSFDLRSTGSVARYRYDFGSNSTAGGTLTDRRGGAYSNRVASADLVYRLTESDRVDVNVATSRTRYAPEMIDAFRDPATGAPASGVPEGTLDGSALALRYSHSERGFWTNASWHDFGDGYRSDLGFRPQVGFQRWVAGGAKIWWPEEEKALNRIGLGGDVDRTTEQDGSLLEEEIEGWFNIDGPHQSFLGLGFGARNRVFEGLEFGQRFGWVFFEIQATGDLNVGVFADGGDWIDFAHIREADRFHVRPRVRYNAGRHLLLEVAHGYSTLNVAGGRLFRIHVPEARVVHQFNARAFVRAILQYTDIRRNPTLYAFTVDEQSRHLLAQLLFSYKLNAQTALYLGYTDNQDGSQDVSLARTDQTLFLKLGYAWVR